MQIEWKMKSGDFLDIIEISLENNIRSIFDKTSDKMFEKYVTKFEKKNYDFVENMLYNFIDCSRELKYRNTIFKFVFEFPDQETAFYYQLKYGISNV